MAGTTGLEPATSAVTGRRSDQLSYVPRLFFNNLGLCHIESSVSQLSLFSLYSTFSPLWTQFWALVDTTWTPKWTPKTATATTGLSLSDESVFSGQVTPLAGGKSTVPFPSSWPNRVRCRAALFGCCLHAQEEATSYSPIGAETIREPDFPRRDFAECFIPMIGNPFFPAGYTQFGHSI